VDPASLPDPPTLVRRHEALIAVEDLVAKPGDAFRMYGVERPDVWDFDSGSGDDYRLVLVGDDALLTVFAHESPQSPWGRDDELHEWPGMFDGLPEHLRARLPREPGEPLSVSACFWFTNGAWHAGNPEPVPQEDDGEDDFDLYAGDPGGAKDLLGPLLDPDEGVRELVVDIWERPERLAEAQELLRAAVANS
jgi:hypothetical protein